MLRLLFLVDKIQSEEMVMDSLYKLYFCSQIMINMHYDSFTHSFQYSVYIPIIVAKMGLQIKNIVILDCAIDFFLNNQLICSVYKHYKIV